MHDNSDARLINTSRSWLMIRIAIPVLGLFGMGISGYLTYIHYQWSEPICLKGMDCNSVLFSPYAEIWGVPISLLGLLIYTILTLFGIIYLCKIIESSSLAALIIYTLALSGTLYSIYLIYREFRMQAFCSWCLGSALIITGILVLSIITISASGLRLK